MSSYPLSDHRTSWINLTRDPEVCTCTPVNPRHTEPWKCVSDEQLAAWREREQPPATSPDTARRACWLWLHFSRDVEARRLSGRVDT